MSRINPIITAERAQADGTVWRQIAACGYANADTAATAYHEGDYTTAGRLWAQSDRLLRTAEYLRRREVNAAA